MPRYLFGDSDPATRRLEVLAAVFAGSSREFLRASAPGAARLALDLGSGPGHTTELLAQAVPGAAVVGLDSSERFVALARARVPPEAGLTFQQHDVTVVPFPTGPADVVYSRFLLTHLTDPGAALAAWSTETRPGGRLLLEEVEWIRTARPTFRDYLRLLEAVLTAERRSLYIGAAVDGLARGLPLAIVRSEVRQLAVSAASAAAMFRPNLEAWRDHPVVRAAAPGAALDRLATELDAIAAGAEAGPPVEWGLRQVALEAECASV